MLFFKKNNLRGVKLFFDNVKIFFFHIITRILHVLLFGDGPLKDLMKFWEISSKFHFSLLRNSEKSGTHLLPKMSTCQWGVGLFAA